MALQDDSITTHANDGNLPEVSVHAEKQYLLPADEGQKELHIADGLQVAPLEPDAWNVHTGRLAPDTPWYSTLWKKKRFWVPLLTLLIVAAIIGGTVGGLLSHRDRSNRVASNEPLDALPTQSSPTVSSTTSDLPRPSASPQDSSLASVAWKDNNGLAYRRLYYQDSAGFIKESAWDNSANKWHSSSEVRGQAKKNSPLAAAVAGNQFKSFQLNLYWIDPDGHLVESYTQDKHSWNNGSVTKDRIEPSPDSDLAATWTWPDIPACGVCGPQGVLLFYTDADNTLRVVNVTTSTTPIQTDLRPGSGLTVINAGGYISMYYQTTKDELAVLDWNSQNGKAKGGLGWALHEGQPIGRVAAGASIASCLTLSYSSSVDDFMNNILSSGPNGVRVKRYGGPKGHYWQDSEDIDIMKNVQAYSAVATNADGCVYAWEAGVVQEFCLWEDGSKWTKIGSVPTQY